MNAIIWKELRQHRGWVAIGWLFVGLLTYLAAPKDLNDFFDAGNYSPAVPMVGLGAAALALALGFAQSFWDYGDRQSDYLRHRAVSEQDIWIGKVAAGAILFAAAVGPPLLVLTFYLARVGPHSLPTRPIQVVPVALMASLCFFFQPAMMLSVRRPAAWLGTRFFPLVAVAIPCGVFAFVAGNTLTAAVVWLACVAVLAAAVGLIRRPSVVNASLIAGAVVAVGLFAMAAVIAVGSRVSPEQPYTYGVDQSNRPWAVQLDYERTGRPGSRRTHYRSAVLLRDRPAESSPVEPPEDLAINSTTRAAAMPAADDHDPGRVRYFGVASLQALYYDRAGYLLLYNDLPSPHLEAYVGRDGFYPQPPPPQARFSRSPSLHNVLDRRGVALLSDRDGIYQMDLAARTVRKLLDGPIGGVYPLEFFGPATPHYVIDRGGQWSRYQIVSDDAEAPEDDADVFGVQPELQVIRLGDLPPPPLAPGEKRNISMAGTPDGQLTIFMTPSGGTRRLISYDPAAGGWQTRVVSDPPSLSRQSGFDLMAATLFPPVLTAAAATASFLYEYRQYGQAPAMSPEARREVITYGSGVLVILLVGCVAVIALKGRYRLTWRQAAGWLLSTLPLGLAAPLAMVAIYTRPVLEDCPSCRRPRRINSKHCEHCGAAWPEPEREGVELFEHARPSRPSPPREQYATSDL